MSLMESDGNPRLEKHSQETQLNLLSEYSPPTIQFVSILLEERISRCLKDIGYACSVDKTDW